MTNKVNVVPGKDGLKVRTENGARHIRPKGESVSLTSYYRRRIAAGDLKQVKDLPEETHEPDTPVVEEEVTLGSLLKTLDYSDQAQATEDGKPSLTYLSDILNRRVTRKEVDAALKEMEA